MQQFSIKIISFNIESSVFHVEYIPEDSTLTTIVQHITIDLSSLDEPSQENIIAILTKNSPQSYWETQIKMRDVVPLAQSLSESMANLVVSSEITSPIYQSYLDESKSISSQPMDTTEVDEFINNVLSKIESNT